jgi:NAD(P)-dependent dehydrogenase (short-subunit alcohol dehydrogenase family)
MGEQLQGKVVLVTGASSGIGRASALACAREGARVVVADVAVDGGEATAHMIKEAGGSAHFVAADVSQAGEVERLVQGIVAACGRLDCAHNNAGIVRGGSTHELSEEDWHAILAVNLTGVWLCMKYEIAQMLRQGGGTIVNTASAAGLVGLPRHGAYVASKHGVLGLTKTAALEYAQQGIRVNAVCPGYIRTPMTSGATPNPDVEAAMVAAEPIGRMGTPEEVAQAVVWLCSDASSFVTGTGLSVDGGYVAQ